MNTSHTLGFHPEFEPPSFTVNKKEFMKVLFIGLLPKFSYILTSLCDCFDIRFDLSDLLLKKGFLSLEFFSFDFQIKQPGPIRYQPRHELSDCIHDVLKHKNERQLGCDHVPVLFGEVIRIFRLVVTWVPVLAEEIKKAHFYSLLGK